MENKKPQEGGMIIDLVGKDARFTKFAEMVNAAGLKTKLSDDRNLTVFAPTNSAFAKLPEDKLKALMKPDNRDQLQQLVSLHVFAGKLSADDLKKANAIKTESGREVRVAVSPDLKAIQVANANVILPKSEAKNGYVYPVDSVLQLIGTTAAAA